MVSGGHPTATFAADVQVENMVPHCVERRVPEAVVTEKKDLIENAIQQAVVMERHRAADVQVENMVPHCVERRVPEAAVTEKKDLREIVLQQAVEMGLSTPWGDTVAGPHIPCITTWDDFVAGPWFPDYIPCLSPAQRRAVTAQCDEVGVPLTRAVCAGGPTGDS